MEIIHHIAFNSRFADWFDRLGIQYQKAPLPGNKETFLGSFEIDESDKRWHTVADIVVQKGLVDVPYTRFSSDEVFAAEWVRCQVVFETEYPQPKDTWIQQTFEKTCDKCTFGSQQKADFRVAREPRMRGNDFMSLYWVPDAVFATWRVFELFSSANLAGYARRRVVNHRTGKAAESIAQVVIPLQTRPGLLVPSDVKVDRCDACGLVRYPTVTRGPIRYVEEALPTGCDFVRSFEWFGDVPYQEMFISNRAARVLLDYGLRGVRLQPLELA
ncbi:MAG: hypothetical protein ACYC1C_14505 [Chloroflexota bacterium]